MPLVKLVRGARYSFDNVLVQNGEVIEVDNRTRNRLVRSNHFIDVAEHERPAFVAMPEDEDEPVQMQGGTNLDDIDDPAITGAAPDGGVKGGRGTGKVHKRSGSDIADQRAAEAAAPQPDAQQTDDPEAATQEATV